ncbi:hypothetical protein LCGC14_0434590 [marine sediment metagenome]|uniref:Uncharacterized protein n=1 Tax=marine sediment metagenome TaxID=412755 RepID=A0A0F9T525_9ZZZZ
MARLSREFVKLETRIINDYRFFTMSEFEQLVYIKLLGISRSNNNQIPKDFNVIKQLLRLKKEETCFYLSQIGFSKQEISTKSETELYQSALKSAIKRIKGNFPKFKENKYFWFFDGYELRLSNSAPKEAINSQRDEDEDLDVDKDLDKDFTTIGKVSKNLTKDQETQLQKYAEWMARDIHKTGQTRDQIYKMFFNTARKHGFNIVSNAVESIWNGTNPHPKDIWNKIKSDIAKA